MQTKQNNCYHLKQHDTDKANKGLVKCISTRFRNR